MSGNSENRKRKYNIAKRICSSILILISFVMLYLLNCIDQTHAQTKEVSLNVKNDIIQAVDRHVQKLKSYTSEAENKYFNQYTDIKTSAYRGFIGRLIHTGITKGTSGTTFSPKAEINGAQFITLLLRAMGYELIASNGQPYYAPYIVKARELGIIESNEMLNPLRVIAKKEAARIVVKAVELWDKIEMNPYYGEVVYKFEGTWGETFKPYIKKVHASGIMALDLKTGIFEADRPLTREEMSMVIVKFVEKTRRTPYDKDKKDVFIIRGYHTALRDYISDDDLQNVPDVYKQDMRAYPNEIKSPRYSICFYEPSKPEFSRILRTFLEYEKSSKRAFFVTAFPDFFAGMEAHWIEIWFAPETEKDYKFFLSLNNQREKDINIRIAPNSCNFMTVQSTCGLERQKQMFDTIKDVYKIILGDGKGLDTMIGWYTNTIFKCTEWGGVGEPFLGKVDTILNGKRVEGHHGGAVSYTFWIYY